MTAEQLAGFMERARFWTSLASMVIYAGGVCLFVPGTVWDSRPEAVSSRAFDLVVTNLSMPGLSGWGGAKGVKKEKPDLPVILLSGWSVQQ